jgi:hypothetical protein
MQPVVTLTYAGLFSGRLAALGEFRVDVSLSPMVSFQMQLLPGQLKFFQFMIGGIQVNSGGLTTRPTIGAGILM